MEHHCTSSAMVSSSSSELLYGGENEIISIYIFSSVLIHQLVEFFFIHLKEESRNHTLL